MTKTAGSAHPQKPKATPKRVLIEEWLPAAAIGVECIRERSTGQQPPDKRFHVWWARRPLTVSRAAVLGSLLPGEFPREVFEKLLGFGHTGKELVNIRRLMDAGTQVPGGFNCSRAFKRVVRQDYLDQASDAIEQLWGKEVSVVDTMAGGGSIPLEAARMGLHALANEYNPVACSVLEATIDYPFRFGEPISAKARLWGMKLVERVRSRLAYLYPEHQLALVHAYIFARTVPCPETKHATPLVPDWHVRKPSNHTDCDERCMLAVPRVDIRNGSWTVEFVRGDRLRGSHTPQGTYSGGKGISLFTNLQIPADYIKAAGQAGTMNSQMYAVALKTNEGLKFVTPDKADMMAIGHAEKELASNQATWKKNDIIPVEPRSKGDCDRSFVYGITKWSDMFSARQLLAMGVLVEELRGLRSEIVKAEGEERSGAIIHLLSFALDKFANHNCNLNRWETTTGVVKGKMDRHDFAFKPAYAELATCGAGKGFEWAIDNVLEAYEELCQLANAGTPVGISFGSATGLPGLADGSVTALIVDPPYADNVQYSELADFFYVWLKRTQGYRRPEWFSTYVCEHAEEAVVNISRNRKDQEPVKQAKRRANEFYQKLMTQSFREAHRILRDDGVLTVMFTHKKQEAWVALFKSLVDAKFTITATWPVKTESEHSLHQARKNAAQSTVLLVARKRSSGGIGYFDRAMKDEIRLVARNSAHRLSEEGLNPVDQLVGSFGPAMAVYSRYDDVRTDTGEPVDVSAAIDEASEAVTNWRIEQLEKRGLAGVEPEGRFTALCWDVLGAAEFRYNEAHLLGKASGMDVDQLVVAGLVEKTGDKVRMIPAKDRRRARALDADEFEETLFGPATVKKRRTKGDVLKVHPNDPGFRTALDGCHAMALRCMEAGGGAPGIGAAKSLARQQNWNAQSPVARLMEALVHAAPEALRHDKGKLSMAAKFPEFRAWHALLNPVFGLEPPDWTEQVPPQAMLALTPSEAEPEDSDMEEDGEENGDE